MCCGVGWLVSPQEVSLTGKILADVMEAFLAALLLDKGLHFAQRFLQVCLFPKLKVSTPHTNVHTNAPHIATQCHMICHMIVPGVT